MHRYQFDQKMKTSEAPPRSGQWNKSDAWEVTFCVQEQGVLQAVITPRRRLCHAGEPCSILKGGHSKSWAIRAERPDAVRSAGTVLTCRHRCVSVQKHKGISEGWAEACEALPAQSPAPSLYWQLGGEGRRFSLPTLSLPPLPSSYLLKLAAQEYL